MSPVKLKVGEKVFYDYSVAKGFGTPKRRKGTIFGTLIDLNPSIAPGSKHVRTSEGKDYYTVAKLKRLK